MYHTQTSPTMVNGTSVPSTTRQRRRYEYHPYSIPVNDLEKSLTSSSSSSSSSSTASAAIIKSES